MSESQNREMILVDKAYRESVTIEHGYCEGLNIRLASETHRPMSLI